MVVRGGARLSLLEIAHFSVHDLPLEGDRRLLHVMCGRLHAGRVLVLVLVLVLGATASEHTDQIIAEHAGASCSGAVAEHRLAQVARVLRHDHVDHLRDALS